VFIVCRRPISIVSLLFFTVFAMNHNNNYNYNYDSIIISIIIIIIIPINLNSAILIRWVSWHDIFAFCI